MIVESILREQVRRKFNIKRSKKKDKNRKEEETEKISRSLDKTMRKSLLKIKIQKRKNLDAYSETKEPQKKTIIIRILIQKDICRGIMYIYDKLAQCNSEELKESIIKIEYNVVVNNQVILQPKFTTFSNNLAKITKLLLTLLRKKK